MDTKTKRNLLEITSDENMKTLHNVANAMIDNWGKNSVIGVTEWETVKNAVAKEERKRALELFLQELENLAHVE